MCDLPSRVNPGIGTARADDRNPTASKKRSERIMEFALHRPLVTLFLPAVERQTMIGDLELHSMHHCGYPRMEWGIGR